MVFQERTYAVLVVSASKKFTEMARTLLPLTNYYPVEVVPNAGAARRTLLESAFDIVLIQSPLRDEFGTRLAADICRGSDASVLLFVKNERVDDVYAKVMEEGVMVLGLPTSTQMVSQSLRMLCAARERLRRAAEKQATVEEKIQEIRVLNRAKWLLIERLQMTEAEAHRYIEKQAMDLRLSRREVAENIIKTY